MPNASLDVVEMKLDLARKDFEELRAASERFIGGDPNTAVGFDIQQNGDAGTHVVTARIPADFPLELGGIVGRALYNLRSSLDNLAWQLVLANGGSPGDHTEFPIFLSETKFKKSAPRKTKGMSEAARAAIEQLQPFNQRPEHPDHTTIWKIHDLNRIDKHRLPHLACLWLAWVKGSISPSEEIGAEIAYVAPRGRIEDGAELFRACWDPIRANALDTEMHVNFLMSIDVGITNPETHFLEADGQSSDVFPVQGLIDIFLKYMSSIVIPAFSNEFL